MASDGSHCSVVGPRWQRVEDQMMLRVDSVSRTSSRLDAVRPKAEQRWMGESVRRPVKRLFVFPFPFRLNSVVLCYSFSTTCKEGRKGGVEEGAEREAGESSNKRGHTGGQHPRHGGTDSYRAVPQRGKRQTRRDGRRATGGPVGCPVGVERAAQWAAAMQWRWNCSACSPPTRPAAPASETPRPRTTTAALQACGWPRPPWHMDHRGGDGPIDASSSERDSVGSPSHACTGAIKGTRRVRYNWAPAASDPVRFAFFLARPRRQASASVDRPETHRASRSGV